MGSRAAWAVCLGQFPVISRTPFLYQTRTLAGTHSTRILSSINRKSSRQIRGLHSADLPGESTEAFRPVEVESAGEKRDATHDAQFTIRRTEVDHTPRAPRRAFQRTDEGHGLKISRYKTGSDSSTRPSRLRKPRGPDPRERLVTTTSSDDFNEFEETNDIRFDGRDSNDIKFEGFDSDNLPGEEEEYYMEKDAIDELTARTDRRKGQESTITRSEKEAFQKIFADIFSKTHPSHSYEGGAALHDPFENVEPDLDPKAPQRAKNLLGNIMNKAAAETPNREKMEEIVNRYPSALRAAAGRAIGLDLATKRPKEIIADEVLHNKRLEELQNAERARVEGLMRAAKTDFALWSVMEKEVFTLIPKLGLKDDQMDNTEEMVKIEEATDPQKDGSPQKSGKKPKKSKKTGAATSKKDEEKTTENDKPDGIEIAMFGPIEDGISPLELYGPLYPSYLLFGLRLLDRSFVKPSPLTVYLHQKIKSLGLISRVLGLSTQLYNELLIIHWFRRDDFKAVDNLLLEMEQSGLSWDVETLNIVEDISKMQRAALRGERGLALKALWSLPEFAPNLFKVWSQKIKQSMIERKEETERLVYG